MHHVRSESLWPQSLGELPVQERDTLPSPAQWQRNSVFFFFC